jgi:hypothetical protein
MMALVRKAIDYALHEENQGRHVTLFVMDSRLGGGTSTTTIPVAETGMLAEAERIAAAGKSDIDAVVIGLWGPVEIEGQPKRGLILFAQERGAPTSPGFFQEVRTGWFRKPSVVGEPIFQGFRPPLLRSAPLDANESRLPQLLVALKQPETSREAFDRLRAMGPSILSALERHRVRDECKLLAFYLEALSISIRVATDPQGFQPFTVAPLDIPAITVSEHLHSGRMPDPAILTLSRVSAERGNRMLAAIARQEIAQAHDLFVSDPVLRDYWQRLRASGWLEAVPGTEHDALMVRLMKANAKDPATIHLALPAVHDIMPLATDDDTAEDAGSVTFLSEH